MKEQLVTPESACPHAHSHRIDEANTSFDKKEFFDKIIAKLQASGALESTDTDLSTRPSLPLDSMQQPTHVGDEIYTDISGNILKNIGDQTKELRQRLKRHNLPESERSKIMNNIKLIELLQAQIILKDGSLQKGITAYMPSQDFANYVTYFCAHPEIDRHEEALGKSLRNQLSNQIIEWPTTSSTGISRARCNYAREQMFSWLPQSKCLQHLQRYSTLLAALGVYHAAHRAYLGDLNEAINSSKELTEREKNVANQVLSSDSFDQFNRFFLFKTILPLAIAHYERLEAEERQSPSSVRRTFNEALSAISGGATSLASWDNRVDNGLMKQAISLAWEDFFDLQLSTRRRNSDGEILKSEDEKVARIVYCPATQHLRASQKAGTVESIYDQLAGNPKDKRIGLARTRAEMLLDDLENSRMF